MKPEPRTRRLAAILAADMVGFTRLMEQDDADTLERQQFHRKNIIEPKISEHYGRIVNAPGDSLLIEFPSALDAVQYAIETQSALVAHEAETGEDRRIHYRMGINLADVIVEQEAVFGHGVNVAARLEALADPGGVCVSRNVFEQIENRLAVDFEYAGEQQVKNVSKPLQVWMWAGSQQPIRKSGEKSSTSLDRKPFIAVLPFQNLSGDPGQEYFADGIAEDVITALTRFPWFFVISRNSSFAYRGQSVDAKEVGRQLGVRYIVEGSARKARDRVRITAQLIDVVNDRHIWAERYDRDLDDIFAAQDEIAQNIIAAVAPQFLSAEMQRARRKNIRELDTWDNFMRAHWHLLRFSKSDNARARQFLEKVLAVDPNNTLALSDFVVTHVMDVSMGWAESMPEALAAAAEAGERAIATGDQDAQAYWAFGLAKRIARRFDEARRAMEKAIALNPNFALAHATLGGLLISQGDPESAITYVNKAMRLSPDDPTKPIWYLWLGGAAFVQERYADAIDWAEMALREFPELPAANRLLAANLALSGRVEDAQDTIKRLLQYAPTQSIEYVKKIGLFDKNTDMDRYLDGLRKAGLPEQSGPSQIK